MVVVIATALPVSADQNDPRLDTLFAQLKTVSSPDEVTVVERSIWTIWAETPDNAITQLLRNGVAALTRRDYRSALRSFDQIVTISPDFAEGWNKRATAHYLLGNYQQALRDIDKTLALEPRHFGALSGQGLVYIELADEQSALKSFEAALAIHPFLPAANHNAKALRQHLKEQEI